MLRYSEMSRLQKQFLMLKIRGLIIPSFSQKTWFIPYLFNFSQIIGGVSSYIIIAMEFTNNKWIGNFQTTRAEPFIIIPWSNTFPHFWQQIYGEYLWFNDLNMIVLVGIVCWYWFWWWEVNKSWEYWLNEKAQVHQQKFIE